MPDKKIISLDELKKFRQETDQKYVIVGEYSPTTSVGQADTLASNREIDDPSESCPPITMGITGGNAEIKTGIEKFEYLEGNSIVFNQLVQNGNFTSTSNFDSQGGPFTVSSNVGTITYSGSGTNCRLIASNINIINTHKYLCKLYIKPSKSCPIGAWFLYNQTVKGNTTLSANVWNDYSFLFTANANGSNTSLYVGIQLGNSAEDYLVANDTLQFKGFMIFDLTLMGLDSITTVDEFNALFPLDYYAYNSGSILSSKAYQLVSRGRQQWDEQWESGLIQYDKTQSNFGQKITGSNVVSKNYIPVIPNQTYYFYGASTQKSAIVFCYDENKTPIIVGNSGYVAISSTPTFTTPINCKYIMFYMAQPYGTTYNNDITISIYFADGEGYDEHYEYRQATVDLPNIELRAVPNYTNGGYIKDIAYASGGGKRKVNIINLGSQDEANYYPTTTQNKRSEIVFYGLNANTTCKIVSNSNFINAICSNYKITSTDSTYLWNFEKAISVQRYNNNPSSNVLDIYITDNAFLNMTKAQMKSALANVYVVYETQNETDIPTSENAGLDENVYVDNYGTLEFITNPQQIPQVKQPYFIRYTVDLVEFLDGTYVRANGDPQNLALQEDIDKIISGETIVGESERADNLTPYGDDSGAYDDTPFTFQTSGGSADIGNGAYLKALRGNSVAFNQLLDLNTTSVPSVSSNNVTITNNGDGSFSVSTTSGGASADTHNAQKWVYMYADHKYLIRGIPAGASYNTYRIAGTFYFNSDQIFTTQASTGSKAFMIQVYSGAVITTPVIFRPQLFDLTQMFGAGNEPTSVLEFNRLFPKAYYGYNAGELLSCKSNGYKIIGYNAFNLDRTEGTLNGNNYSKGNKQDFKETEYYLGLADNDYILRTQITNLSISGNSITFTSAGGGYGVALPVRIIAGQTYTLEFECNITGENKFVSWYDENGLFISRTSSSNGNDFIAPNNAYWGVIILGRGVNTYTYTNISFHLTWDGSKTGYEPYYSETYALPNVELRSAGSVYDELKPDGTLIRRVGSVNLGSLNWSYASGQGMYSNDLQGLVKNSGKCICARYLYSSTVWASKCIGFNTTGVLWVADTSYTNADTFKTAMSGVYLNYELATPTEEQTTNTFQEITKIDDFGTQEFLYDSDIDIPVPQGNEFFYPVDYKAFIDSLGGRDDIGYDASEIVSHSELSASETQRDSVDTQLKDAIGGTLRNCVAIKGSIGFNTTTFIDLSSASWSTTSNTNVFAGTLSTSHKTFTYGTKPNACCSKYDIGVGYGGGDIASFQDQTIHFNYAVGNIIYIKDTNYSSLDTFKNSLKGVILAYEKAS